MQALRRSVQHGLPWAAGAAVVVATAASMCGMNVSSPIPSAQADSFEVSAGLLQRRVEQLEIELSKRTNSAFVFIKPHAVTPAVLELVKSKFADEGIVVTSEGVLDYKTIDQKMLIDTHYGAIASKAMKIEPADLAVTDKAKAAFKQQFGMTWDAAIKKGIVYNAAGACKKLKTDGNGLDKKWSAIDKKTGLVKFGGGFYCGKVGDIFVINGFYMSMRGSYTEAPAKINYLTVEWDAATLSWEDFRSKVLGATDPDTASEGSLRKSIRVNWEKLGLAKKPLTTGDNGVHASASPFEALAERCNWLEADIQNDPFGKAMLAAGISQSTVASWFQDPQVLLPDGSKGSLFDAIEDTNAVVCLEKAKKLNSIN